jgi:hypothetical protein
MGYHAPMHRACVPMSCGLAPILVGQYVKMCFKRLSQCILTLSTRTSKIIKVALYARLLVRIFFMVDLSIKCAPKPTINHQYVHKFLKATE